MSVWNIYDKWIMRTLPFPWLLPPLAAPAAAPVAAAAALEAAALEAAAPLLLLLLPAAAWPFALTVN